MDQEKFIKNFDIIVKKFKNYKNFKDLSIESIEDIQKIPLSTKDDLQNFKIEDCPTQPVAIWNTSEVQEMSHSLEYLNSHTIDS